MQAVLLEYRTILYSLVTEVGGGEQGGLNLRFPYTLIPVPTLYLLAPASLLFSIAKYCSMLRSFPFFSRFPPPLLPPPVHLPHPLLPVSRPLSPSILIALLPNAPQRHTRATNDIKDPVAWNPQLSYGCFMQPAHDPECGGDRFWPLPPYRELR